MQVAVWGPCFVLSCCMLVAGPSPRGTPCPGVQSSNGGPVDVRADDVYDVVNPYPCYPSTGVKLGFFCVNKRERAASSRAGLKLWSGQLTLGHAQHAVDCESLRACPERRSSCATSSFVLRFLQFFSKIREQLFFARVGYIRSSF